jgi:signal peptidase II
VRSGWTVAAVGLIGGGAGGNLVDRIVREPGGLHGHVVDFISIGDFAIFNVADVAINAGVIVYLVYALLVEPRRRNDSDSDGDSDSDDHSNHTDSTTTTEASA